MSCPFLFESTDIPDSEDLSEDVDDTPDLPDFSDDIDTMLDNMSLDELHEFRDELTGGDGQDGNIDISSLSPLDDPPEPPDYGFHWDGGPTHDTDLDEDNPPEPKVKKLTR